MISGPCVRVGLKRNDGNETTEKTMNIRTILAATVLLAAFSTTLLAEDQPSTGTTTSSTPPTNTQPAVITGPVADALKFITTSGASNWVVAPYLIYDDGNREFGAGIGLGYQLSQYFVPTLRCDYLNKEIWMPSASMQLQAPVTIMGKLTATPFVFGGMATPLSGQEDENGSLVGIYGVGMSITLKKDRLYLLGDVEQWNGAKFTGRQYRAGLGIKF